MEEQENRDRLVKAIKHENDFFTSVIDWIPPEHFGYDDEVKEILRNHKHALVDEKLSEDKRTKLSNKSKQRLSRLDGRQCKTNSQIFAYLAEMKKHEGKGNKKRGNETIQANDGGNIKEKPSKKARLEKKAAGKKQNGMNGTITSDGPMVKDRQYLLLKLQAKMDELRANRGGSSDKSRGLSYEEKKRLKRKLSKAKLKERRRVEKQQHGSALPVDNKKPNSLNQHFVPSTPAKNVVNGPARKEKSGVKSQNLDVNGNNAISGSTSATSTKRPAIVDKDGRMVFSKFDLALPGIAEDTGKDKWAKKNSGKDYKRLLENQERLQEKIQKMKEAGNEEGAKKLKEKTQWRAAIQRAEGFKVKDDPTLLKKNLKRKEKGKKQSERKWDTRNETVRKKQDEKQQKRKDNIQDRRNEKKNRKLAKARKKGRLV